jgi:2'-5' RNA ligase
VTQSVEVLLDDELDAAVRREWVALAAAGLPSQARHTGDTNRPHVTLCVASSVLPYIETALKAALTGRLPLTTRLGGLLCFAARDGRQVLARAVVPSPELLALQATCAGLFDGLPGTSPLLQPGAWTPHVTLARNLPTEEVSAAIAALGRIEERGRITELTGRAVAVRRWDSDTRTAWLVG